MQLRNFYTGKPFRIQRIVAATAPGMCFCGQPWDEDEAIAVARWGTEDSDFARMHAMCAMDHPNRIHDDSPKALPDKQVECSMKAQYQADEINKLLLAFRRELMSLIS